MSDHIHVLLRIRGSHSIGQIVGRLKSKTRKVLAEVELTWQPSYFERQLRQGDLVGDVLRYIYLNPYREGLIRTDKIYDHFWLGSEDSAWFRPTTDDDHPFPQWLM